MSEGRGEGLLTVAAGGLGAEGEEGSEDADEAVLEDAEPDDLELSADIRLLGRKTNVEPRQPASWSPQAPPFSSTTFPYPAEWPHPRPNVRQLAKIIFLVVQGGCHIMA